MYQHRLRKLRLRDRRERKRKEPGVARTVCRATQFTQSITQMRAPLRAQDAIPQSYHWLITHKWQQAFKGDPAMKALLAEERNGNEALNNKAGLFVQEFQNSPDVLDTRIHRLFRPSNFQHAFLSVTKLSKPRQHEAWMRMKPALTLATRFLLAPELQAFWIHLMYGVPVSDRATKKTYLMHSGQEDDLETARTDFAALLEDLADRICFHWEPAVRGGRNIFACHGPSFWSLLKECTDISKFPMFRGLPKPAEGYNGYIGLSSIFLYHLLSPNSPTQTSIEADIRVQINLAITITHELAHAVYAWRGLPFVAWHNGSVELFVHDTDKVSNEVGWSWEHHAFDGVTLQCNFSHDEVPAVKCMTLKTLILGEPFIWCLVPDAWLKSLFFEETWGNILQVMKDVPRPAGEPYLFRAQRFIEGQGFQDVDYLDRLAVSPGHWFFNELEGPVPQETDVQAWFKLVRARDMRKALRTGSFASVVRRGPRGEVLGEGLVPAQAAEEHSEDEDNPSDEGYDLISDAWNF